MTQAKPVSPGHEFTAHPRRWAILSVLVVSLLVVVLDNTIMNVALKTIQESLRATQSQVVWAINAYVLFFAAMLFTWGVLGDRYGRKKVLIIGLLLFGASSALTSFAETPTQLILARGLMGATGACMLPVTLAIITVVFPPHERGKAIGIWASAVGGAVALGPVLGGLLLEWFWWGSIFFINVPIVIIGVIGIALMVPESKNPKFSKLDPFGLLLSITGLLLFVYGIAHGGEEQKWFSLGVIGPILVGIALVTLFLVLQSKSPHPSMDLSLFKIRSFSASLTAVSLTFATMMGSLLFMSFYMQLVRGFSPLKAGLCTVPVAIGQLLAAPRSAGMVAKFGARKVMIFGLSLAGVVFLGIGFLQPQTALWAVLVLFFLLGFGLGNVIAPATTRMTLATPQAKAGAGSAVQNTVRQVAAAIGVAVMSSIVAVAYTTGIDRRLAGVPIPAQVRGPVRDSIGAAYEVIGQASASGAMTPAQASTLQAASSASFMDAFHIVSWTGFGLVVIGVVVLLTYLPAQPETAAWTAQAHGREPTTEPVADTGDETTHSIPS